MAMERISRMGRRDFVKGLGLAGAAASLSRAGSAEEKRGPKQQPGTAVTTVALGRPTLPVLRKSDVVVVGGGFAGVCAALQLARAGRKVVIVEPRTYLGREATATLRPWISSNGPLPEVLQACVAAPAGVAANQEVPLKPDRVKLALEDMLLAAGIEFLYACYPIGVCADGAILRALVIGNKSGRQVLPCRMILDTTETATVARVAGAPFEAVRQQAALFRRTIEFDGVQPVAEHEMQVPGHLGVAGDRVVLHQGCRGKAHVLVESALELPVQEFEPADVMKRELEARRRSMQVAVHLIQQVPAFNKAYLAASSYELLGPATTRMSDQPGDWTKALPALRTATSEPDGGWPLGAFAGPLKGVWCLNEAARVEPSQALVFRNPVSACLIGEAFGRYAAAQWNAVAADVPPAAEAPAAKRDAAAQGGLEVREQQSPQPGRPYEQASVAATNVPVLRNVDVLVVGGGTSGATAAAVCAREGVKTLVLEMNPGLGGTGTIGAIDSYWYGRRGAFNARVTERVAKVHESIKHHPVSGGRWNVEAKMHALLQEAEGAEVLFNSIVAGAIVENGSVVRGVVVATRCGLRAVLAKVVIDATGDGDVAAFAGAQAVRGSVMDHVAMWYALAQFVQPGRNRNSFTSALDVSNIEDCNRALLAGRRRGADSHDHGIYLATRESRHILGDAIVSLTDHVRQRRWPDVVNIHYSNHDMKGKTTSQWLDSGLIPPHLEIEVPYRALLPKGLENILVAGKAISATHDSLVALRMQADMENLGGVVALAAAQAVKESKSPRAIDVARLQQRLVKEGVLPADTLERKLHPRRYTDAQLRALVDSLIADKPLLAYQDMKMFAVFRGTIPFVEVCTAGPRAVPFLEETLRNAPEDKRLPIAQALAVCGSQAGVPVLVGEAEKLLAGGKLPPRKTPMQYVGTPPDHGAAPEAVYLLYSLGMTRDKRSLAVWQRVADLFNPKERDYWDLFLGPFCYADAVCYGAERLGDPAAVPILEKLHTHPTVHGLVSRAGAQADWMLERRAMLELAIGKALARCGSPKGVTLLIAYLDDNRALLAEQAYANLVRICGCDHGMNSTAWTAWLEQSKDTLKPQPLQEDLDTVYEADVPVLA